jgi:hypothetical protein
MNDYKPTDTGPHDYIFIGSEIWTKEELAEWWRRYNDRQKK